jgi:hypothetical protein
MSAAHDPAAPVSAEQSPLTGTASIPLPPVPHATAPQATAAHGRRAWIIFLAFLVLTLAFLSASFVARNSDLWFHLATGRLVAQGRFSFGVDPFSYTTKDVYWACHSWLFDLVFYELYGLVGGTGLVVLKALFVAALAGLLLRVRRIDGAFWPSVVCTTLAIVATSPRLQLQPACASYGLLALTLWLLWKPQESAMHVTSNLQFRICHLLLPLLFALWVNIDEWFLLGPILAALFWVGERLQGVNRTPGWVAPVGLAACLLNPFTFHAFTLPSELFAFLGAAELRDDVRFQAIFASPWSVANLRSAWTNPAAIAYFALTLLGLVSFVLNRKALWGWRLIVWLPFMLLAAWQVRTIPFFVVVAAPITALNLQDFLARLAEAKTESDDSRPGSRSSMFALLQVAGGLVLVIGLPALIYFTWTGWQWTPGREGRHVAWGVQPEPSLQRVAETLDDWRREGLLLDGERVFAISPEVAQHAAWFAPGEEHFLDHRYQLFRGTAVQHRPAHDFEVVCRALLPDIVPSGAAARGAAAEAKDWRQVLRDHNVSVVVFFDRDPQRLFSVLHRLANDPQHWTLLDISGQALVFGWNEARAPGAFAPLAFDADRLAFGHRDELSRHALPVAPERGPERLAPERGYWPLMARTPAPPVWESIAATMYLHYADDSDARQRQRQQDGYLMPAYAAGLAGMPMLPSAVPGAAVQLVQARDLLYLPDDAPRYLVREQLGPFFAPLVERSPALPLLAVRAARRAVAANPENSNAWLRLGQAYLLLRNSTCERSAEGLLPPLAQLRYVQIVNALEQAVRLDPDLEVAHHELAFLFGERNYLDQALEHRQDEVRLSRRAGPRSGETDEERADRLELLEKDTAKLEQLVQERRLAFANAPTTLQGGRLAQAGNAVRMGLGRKALDEILLQFPADLLGTEGIKLELEMLLMFGRADDVRTNLSEEALQGAKNQQLYYTLLPPRGGDGLPLYVSFYDFPAYEWLRTLQAGALGDYAQARDALGEIRARLQSAQDSQKQQLQEIDRLLVSRFPGLLSGPLPLAPAVTVQAISPLLAARAQCLAAEPTFRAQRADLFVLEGLLDLEWGATDAARSAFTEAVELCTPLDGPAIRFAGRPIATSYLGKLNVKD